jgi:hypothetical protein
LHAAQVVSKAPLEQGGGGWVWILSDLKTLLETGQASGRSLCEAGGAPRRRVSVRTRRFGSSLDAVSPRRLSALNVRYAEATTSFGN